MALERAIDGAGPCQRWRCGRRWVAFGSETVGQRSTPCGAWGRHAGREGPPTATHRRSRGAPRSTNGYATTRQARHTPRGAWRTGAWGVAQAMASAGTSEGDVRRIPAPRRRHDTPSAAHRHDDPCATRGAGSYVDERRMRHATPARAPRMARLYASGRRGVCHERRREGSVNATGHDASGRRECQRPPGRPPGRDGRTALPRQDHGRAHARHDTAPATRRAFGATRGDSDAVLAFQGAERGR